MRIFLAIFMVVFVCGCSTGSWKDWFQFKKPDPVVIQVPVIPVTTIPVAPPVKPPAEVVPWPAYDAPSFFRPSEDSNESANEYRWDALAKARLAGVDCLRIRPDTAAMTDERAMHLLHMSHPERPDYFLGSENWWNRAQGYGVKRYIFEIPAGDKARWKYLTRDYPEGTIQWVVDGKTLDAL